MDELQSKIQWTDFTINLWRGCFKVDSDCLFCYMYRDMQRLGHDGKDIVAISLRTINAKIKAARLLADSIKITGSRGPVKVFISSWTDALLDHPIAAAMRPHLWRIIRENPDIIFQVLTKRPENFEAMKPDDWGMGYENVWLGTSVGSVDGLTRAYCLVRAAITCRIKFLSIEPFHEGPLNIANLLDRIKWVIVGGESGNDTGKYRYRECKIEWIEGIVELCKYRNTPVFVKQLGTHLSKTLNLHDRHGGEISEWPEHLQIRELPPVL